MADWPSLSAARSRGEIHDVLASDDHVVVLQTERGERDGHGFDASAVPVIS